jgi:hypothetical protein
MGRRFDVVYDDFTGGHFVGATQTKQPRDTWTGVNAICTADEGFLMPDAGTTQVATILNGAGTDSARPARVLRSGDMGVVVGSTWNYLSRATYTVQSTSIGASPNH